MLNQTQTTPAGRTATRTPADYAAELLAEARANNEPAPFRFAFVDALTARGTDARTRQFKHYNAIVKYMITAWPEELN